jgi:acyl carrier protein
MEPDSLDIVELVMAFEDALSQLPPGQERDRLIREIEARIAEGDFGDESDDTLAALVRAIRPRHPSGHAGAAEVPEEPYFE